MARRSSLSPLIALSTLAWAVALALAPWWIGFPLLLAMVAALLLLEHRLAPEHRWLLRHGLNWGLPGALFALQREIGGNIFAWVIALLGMLTGYTLLAGLEAWLDRDLRRAKTADAAALGKSSGNQSTADASTEWPRLALAPLGPPVEIIELTLPVWLAIDRDSDADGVSQAQGIDDPHGGRATFRDGAYLFDDGTRVESVAPWACFSPQGRWFVARMPDDRGTVLRDREQGRQHRLRHWQLDGWHREMPWLIRRGGDMPLALVAVLGKDAGDD
jgi:hypothetical protein